MLCPRSSVINLPSRNLMLRAKEGAVPPGGWRYPQKTQLGEVELTAPDKETLINVVISFRIQNSIPLGSPQDDIDTFVCTRWPHYCGAASVEGEPYVQEYSHPKNFRERISNFLAIRYSQAGSIGLENEDVAEERAKICATCPQNTEWRIGCPPCVSNAERQSFLIRQGRSTETKALGCAITGQDNATAVHLPERFLRHRNRFKDQLEAEAPHCWLLRLNTNE